MRKNFIFCLLLVMLFAFSAPLMAEEVTPADYSYNAICWAVENGITLGITPTTFGPQEPCTRGQIVTFLYRYYAE